MTFIGNKIICLICDTFGKWFYFLRGKQILFHLIQSLAAAVMRSTLPDAPMVGLKLTPDTVRLFPTRLSAGPSADYHKRQATEQLQGGKHDWNRSIL